MSKFNDLIGGMVEENQSVSAYPFPIAGIGASAGGMDAFKKLVSGIPADSGIAYILIQHFNPEQESALRAILQQVTTLPVIDIKKEVVLSPGNIYILPPNKMFIVHNGKLQLETRPPRKESVATIDQLFIALAETCQNTAIGVVLSGMDGDGTTGLKSIKEQGGLTFVQDPSSASFPDMPQHAEDAGVADFILAPELIPGKMLELIQSLNLFKTDVENKTDKTTEDGFRQLLTMLRVRLGVDFSFYKQSTIRRRIIRRMVILRHETILDYLLYIKQNIQELDTLFNDLLIPVTSFFRDPIAYGQLKEVIFPEILKKKTIAEPVRIWVAGCSTGQEAYSIAISLQEYLSQQAAKVKVQIFASDVSDKAIKKARSGVFTKKELENISEQRLEQYFTKLDGYYQIKKDIRDNCVFATHNLLKDPPFARMDLITCRNVLIYFQPFLQKKALSIFHYALSEKSFLWLGKSETAGQADGLFISHKSNDKFFVRNSTLSRPKAMLLQDHDKVVITSHNLLKTKERKADDFQKIADDILLAKYTPPGIIVNEQFDIVQFRGNTGEYLSPLPGKASLNVFKMAKEGLAFELRNALHKARKTGLIVIKERLLLNKDRKLLTIEVLPLNDSIEPHYMILFKEEINLDAFSGAEKGKVSRKKRLDERSIRIRQLEQELAQSREDMRALTEDQESANEELQSSNEELLSGSEELQSLNEELETSREEVQSTNEELVTVNQELYKSNIELDINRKFAEATLATLHEPLIVIDSFFKIRSANNAFYRSFQITEQETLEKSLFQLQQSVWDTPELITALNQILAGTEKMVEAEIKFNLNNVGERIVIFNLQPLNRPNGEKLILMALNDITLLCEKNLQENVRAIVTAQEDERRRISEILHNELGQLLSMVKLGLDADQQEAADLLNQAIVKVRNLSYELVPPVLEDFGLEVALKDMFDQSMTGHQIKLTSAITGLKSRLDPVIEITVYRIIQELLNNVIKHSGATKADLKLVRTQGHINIRFSDNGSGMPDAETLKEKKGFGIGYISGRVTLLHGQIRITSESEKGSKTLIELPC